MNVYLLEEIFSWSEPVTIGIVSTLSHEKAKEACLSSRMYRSLSNFSVMRQRETTERYYFTAQDEEGVYREFRLTEYELF